MPWLLPAQFDEGFGFESGSGNESISLTMIRSQVVFQVNSFEAYNEGLGDPFNHVIEFTVASDVDFDVRFGVADFQNEYGDVIDPRNFGYRVESLGMHRTGSNFKFMGTGQNPSRLVLMDETREIISSHGQGNAGSNMDNHFKITVQLGTKEVRDLSNLPPLVKQRIADGHYGGRVMITVLPEPW
ncbi:MAG: hypothetical protein D6722_25620 [Bacteroidetes bacterium]|nr:MAG: hypothetical protein D6722_25620 [Bacteroidota bacterium]